jgi:hypothetical protein
MKKFLILLCVFVVLFAFITEPARVEASASLALLLGGTSAAKAFLAFMMSCVAMGVTYATYDQAKAAYDHYLENSTMSIEDLRYIQQETWTGNYEGVTSDISDMKDSFHNWLSNVFGTLNVGLNTYSNYIPVDSTLDRVVLTSYQNNKTYLYKGYTFKIVYTEPNNWKIYKNDGTFATMNNYYQFKHLEFKVVGSNVYCYVATTGGSTQANYNISEPTSTLETLELTITSDAPINNQAYTPQNRTFPAAPYLPYIDFDNEKVSQSISAAGGTMEVYNGTYDQYLDDIVENATWEDIQGISAGTVPTTTLTETPEGLIIGESTVGIPYPIPNESAPTDVLEGIGSIKGILQSIINWFHQLIQFLKSLFMIPEGFMVGIMDDLKNDISGKFDNTLWIGHIQSFGTIEAEGIPDLEFRGEIILESDYVNNIAPTVKAWVSGGMIILIALYNLNQVYKLIRGSDYVGDRGRSKA